MAPEAGKGFGFWVRDGLAPEDDPAWFFASGSARRQFWRQVSLLAVAEYEADREDGIDRHGNPAAPLSPRTIAQRRSAMTPNVDWTAPPFIPGHSASRVVSYLRPIVTEHGVWMRWRHDYRLGATFGQLLFWHARGMVRGCPIRDVLGLSPQATIRVWKASRRWWRSRRHLALSSWAARTMAIEPTPRVEITAGTRVVPLAERGPNPFARGGRTERTITARSGVDTFAGERLGAGTVGRQSVLLRPTPPPIVIPPRRPLPVRPPRTVKPPTAVPLPVIARARRRAQA